MTPLDGANSAAFFLNFDSKFAPNSQPGRGINRKNSNENLETTHLAPALFSYLPGLYLKTGILNPSPFLPNSFKI